MKTPILGKRAESLQHSTFDDVYTAGLISRSRWDRGVAAFCLLITAGSVAYSWVGPVKHKEVASILTVNESGQIMYPPTRLDGNSIIPQTELRDKANLSAFVRAYEGYNFYRLTEPYNMVRAMSSPSVWAPFNAIYSGDNPRDKDWKMNQSIDIEVLNTIPADETGTVRFKKTHTTTQKVTITCHVASATFDYEPIEEIKTKEDEERVLLNWTGFTVYDYRVDPDRDCGS